MADDAEGATTPAQVVLNVVKKAAGKDDASEKPADTKPATPNRWAAGVDRYRTTTTWILGAFVAVITAAIGTGPFIVLDNVTTTVEAIWTIWGLVAAIGGTLIIIYAAASILTPINTTIAKLLHDHENSTPLVKLLGDLNERQEYFYTLSAGERDNEKYSTGWPGELAADSNWTPSGTEEVSVGWRQHKTAEEFVYWTMAIEKTVWDLDRRIDQALSTTPPSVPPKVQKGLVETLEKRRARFQVLLDDHLSEFGRWNDRARYRVMEYRYRAAIPVILLAGGVVTVGLLAFLGAARISIEGDNTEAGALGGDVLVELNDGDTIGEVLNTDRCKRSSPFAATYISGNGTQAEPWVARTVDVDGCDAAQFTMTTDHGQIYRTGTLAVIPMDDANDANSGDPGPLEGCDTTNVVQVQAGTGSESGKGTVDWVVRGDGDCVPAWTAISQANALVAFEPVPSLPADTVVSTQESLRWVEGPLARLTSPAGAAEANVISWFVLLSVLPTLGWAARGIRNAERSDSALVITAIIGLAGVFLTVATGAWGSGPAFIGLFVAILLAALVVALAIGISPLFIRALWKKVHQQRESLETVEALIAKTKTKAAAGVAESQDEDE